MKSSAYRYRAQLRCSSDQTRGHGEGLDYVIYLYQVFFFFFLLVKDNKNTNAFVQIVNLGYYPSQNGTFVVFRKLNARGSLLVPQKCTKQPTVSTTPDPQLSPEAALKMIANLISGSSLRLTIKPVSVPRFGLHKTFLIELKLTPYIFSG
jgi:hypothetical protein